MITETVILVEEKSAECQATVREGRGQKPCQSKRNSGGSVTDSLKLGEEKDEKGGKRRNKLPG